MKITRTHLIHNTALLFILIAPFTVAYYAIYIFNPIHMDNFYLYALQVFADLIAIIIVGSLWITIILDLLQSEYNKRDIVYKKDWINEYKPKVDVLIPTANEPYEIVTHTIKKAIDLDYPHKTYVLDDGQSNLLETFAKSVGAIYVTRDTKHMAKSGNLNNALKNLCKGEFFAVFDADHEPKKDFLSELLPFFENKNIALVQTPQHYINIDNFIASGTAQAQELFYKYVQPAKNSYNAAFCVGTNMMYRRKAIDEIGGIAMVSHSEDIWTTIMLHEKKFDSVFYNKILAEGRAPDNISSFFRQQNRWARGGFTLFFNHNPLFIANLSLDQKLQYFFSNIHYFSGFAILIYLLLPIIYLLTGAFPIDIKNNQTWLIHYLPFFITVYFLPLFLLGNLKLSTISTSIASFYPYLRAFFSVVIKNSYTWVATESKGKGLNLIMYDIWPHILIIFLSLFSIVVGWYNVTDFATTTVTTIWVLLNSLFLFLFVKTAISVKI